MRSCLVFLVLIWASGCSLSSKQATVALHDLGPAYPVNVAGRARSSVIKVSAPDWLTETRLYYRQLFSMPTVLKAYTRDRWIAPPSELLERRFSLIKTTHSLILKIQLVDFEQQFDAPEQARSLFSFDVQVFRSGVRKLLGQRYFKYQQKNETANAIGAINSFVELTNRAAADLESWLDALSKAGYKQEVESR